MDEAEQLSYFHAIIFKATNTREYCISPVTDSLAFFPFMYTAFSAQVGIRNGERLPEYFSHCAAQLVYLSRAATFYELTITCAEMTSEQIDLMCSDLRTSATSSFSALMVLKSLGKRYSAKSSVAT